MNDFSGAVYHPPREGLPHMVAIFKDGEVVAFRAVDSEQHGLALVEEAVLNLPLLGDTEDMPRA